MSKIDHLKLEFEESFPIGKKREKVVFDFLIEFNSVKNIEPNDDYRYDQLVTCSEKKFTLEIKFDDMCLKTGNFAVECTSRGHLSGINRTESDIWCFVDSNNKLYFIKTPLLKKMCIGKRQIQTRCEDSWNKVYLIKMTDFNNSALDIRKFLENEC